MKNIKHRPIFNTKKVEELYSQKDGVSIKYTCTSALNDTAAYSTDVFYRETPHPKFGNRYFGLYNNHMGQVMITNADMIEELVFGMIRVNNQWHYSQHRHDFYKIDDKIIDGGRSYVRTNVVNDLHHFKVKDGKFYNIQTV